MQRGENRQPTQQTGSCAAPLAPRCTLIYKMTMKATAFALALAMGVALLPSCADMTSLSSTSSNTVGTVAQVIPGTVVSARTVEVDASSSDKSLGTGIGAALGAGSGSLLGRGKGQIVSTVGFGVLGSLVGRGIGKEAGKITGQELTIKPDKGSQQYRVTQPIYKELGAIPVGTHGSLEYSSTGSKFVPDGM